MSIPYWEDPALHLLIDRVITFSPDTIYNAQNPLTSSFQSYLDLEYSESLTEREREHIAEDIYEIIYMLFSCGENHIVHENTGFLMMGFKRTPSSPIRYRSFINVYAESIPLVNYLANKKGLYTKQTEWTQNEYSFFGIGFSRRIIKTFFFVKKEILRGEVCSPWLEEILTTP